MNFWVSQWVFMNPDFPGGVTKSHHPGPCRPESVQCRRPGSCYWRQIQRSAPPWEWRSCRRGPRTATQQTLAEHGRIEALPQIKCKESILAQYLRHEFGHWLTHGYFPWPDLAKCRNSVEYYSSSKRLQPIASTWRMVVYSCWMLYRLKAHETRAWRTLPELAPKWNLSWEMFGHTPALAAPSYVSYDYSIPNIIIMYI